jgi:N-acetylglucosaminyldiphosphoundecaprenol N-acetyl-beta-D-mannosaminyltransferase
LASTDLLPRKSLKLLEAQACHLKAQAATVMFLGCPVTTLNYSQVLEWMSAAVEQRRNTHLVTLNAQYLWEIKRDASLKAHILGAGLIVPEYAIVWGARRLNLAPLHYMRGISLTQHFFELSAAKGYRIYLLGAKPEVVAALADQLTQKYGPGLVAGWHDGYLSEETEAQISKDIKRLKPDAVFVSMGVPKQDLWIDRYSKALGIPLCVGTGGSFDVLAGFKPDTPAWAQGKGLEWLYRTYLDPAAYLKRYMVVNTWFLWQVYREKLGLKITQGLKATKIRYESIAHKFRP